MMNKILLYAYCIGTPSRRKIAKAQENLSILKSPAKTVLADAGYCSESNFEALESRKDIEGLISIHKEQEMKKKEPAPSSIHRSQRYRAMEWKEILFHKGKFVPYLRRFFYLLRKHAYKGVKIIEVHWYVDCRRYRIDQLLGWFGEKPCPCLS